MEDSKQLLLWIRALIPLICAGLLISSPDQPVVQDVLMVSGADTALQLWRAMRKVNGSTDLRFALSRDAVYAMLFFVGNFHSQTIPALAFAPVVATEILTVFGWRYFILGFAVEFVLGLLHMGTARMTFHRFAHPAWMMELVIATLASVIYGIVYSHLRRAKDDISRQRTLMKESLTEMLQTTFADRGLESELTTDGIRQMIEEICQSANPEKGRQLGSRLAQMLTNRQKSQCLLTARETEMLSYLATGLSYSKIAKKLIVSEGTVRAHSASIMRKAGVHTRQEVVEWAFNQNLISRREEPKAALPVD